MSKLEGLVTQADANGQQQLGVVPAEAEKPKSPGLLGSFCRCFRSGHSSASVLPEPHTPEPTSPERTYALTEKPQLGPQLGRHVGMKTLVLDLDETLIHSSFRPVDNAEIVISVEIEGEYHYVYVRKRPYVDQFLERVSPLYELVVYTASVAKYANPLMDQLDKKGYVTHRLFREACTKCRGGYVKDLSKLGRNLDQVCIIDNSPICYSLQPENAIPIKTWLEDPLDRELEDLVPILIALAGVDNIPTVLKQTLHNEEDEEDNDW